MKITINWLKEHLDTKLNENQIIDKLTDVGLEVEGVDSQSGAVSYTHLTLPTIYSV